MRACTKWDKGTTEQKGNDCENNLPKVRVVTRGCGYVVKSTIVVAKT